MTIPEERVEEQWTAKSRFFTWYKSSRERALDRVIIPEKPFIRHVLLSTLGSVYDPLRPARLFIREGRPITKNLCKENFSWDERIPRNTERQWVQWLHRL